MINPDSKRPIAIEDLLRLKRAERPPAEFWNEFDRALRAKQLAALVQKRPWWQTMPRVFSGLKRSHIPIGASAIIAVTFFAFRNNFVAPTPQREARSIPSPAVAANAASVIPTETLNENGGPSHLAEQPRNVYVSSDVAPTATASGPVASGEAPRIIPLISASSTESPQQEMSPSALAIAENLATVRGTEPVLAGTLLRGAGGLEARPISRITVEPLQQMTPPSDRRRSNLLTAMVSMASLETPVRPNDRTISRLSQEELYDRFHRFDARASSVNMKF